MDVTPSDLDSIYLLADLSSVEKQELIKQLHVRQVKKADMVVHKGQPSSELYFLLKGRLKVVDYSSSGKEVGFLSIEAGSHFGEIALIDGKPRSASIVATEQSVIAFLSKSDAQNLMYSKPSVSEKLLKQLANIIRQNNDHIVMLGTTNAISRINIVLLKYAKPVNGELEIQKLPTQEELANITNTSRETVSRTLTLLIEKNLIKKSGRHIIILKPKELETMTFK
ncbi:Crp/Fnr family transcriptional regulator [Pontibacterium sp. N1Y112]|uniref:Crp/Fnr family transcriptional regulator n=1 Tax=Pontibacterium sinense TaxID=2781979 RepID=A0A8J7K4S4_9GAMM|nr:Crp/Fnr family transcriptional regulator [Pontibacterium sinense]MBE9395960.1 Crp/Fnr family transcriptional regulator [Pontibacterium sinense]